MEHRYRSKRIQEVKYIIKNLLLYDKYAYKNIDSVVEFLIDYFSNRKSKIIKKQILIDYKILNVYGNYYLKFLNFLSENKYIILEKINVNQPGKEFYYFNLDPGEKINNLLFATKDKRGKSIYKENEIINIWHKTMNRTHNRSEKW